MERYHCSRTQKIKVVIMAIVPEIIYSLNAVYLSKLNMVFKEIEQSVVKFVWNQK